ncbi:hypothetical protein [Pararhizobium sp. PWRC1-1]|uniref:hypothetical protein n=1 Tax=Pararhizobium sp. PWRC1-1 TaxID=2804566 RepID=UPI003CF4E53E
MEQVREHLLKSEASEIATFVSWMSRTSVIDGLPFFDVPVFNMTGAHDAIVPPSDPSLLPRVHTVILDKVDRLISTFLLFGPLTPPRKQSLTNRARSHPLVNAMPAGIK